MNSRYFHRLLIRISLPALLLASSSLLARGASPGEEISRDALDQTFCAALERLASQCEEAGLSDQAAIARGWAVQRTPGRETFFLPSEDLSVPAANAPHEIEPWQSRFREIRAAHAEQLFALARQELEGGNAAKTFALLHETLRENPDHAGARNALGYRPNNNAWIRGEAETQPRLSSTAHPRLGWRARQYWRFNTEHYSILTNKSEAAAVALGHELETLYGIWNQLFFDYAGNPTELAARLEGAAPRRSRQERHAVILFSSQEEYIAHLIGQMPRITLSKGLYRNTDQTTYLCAGEESVIATWYHEAAHQLFYELGSRRVSPGMRTNFWAVEGVALYMESLVDHGSYYTTGGFDADRMQFARFRVFNAQWQIPLADLVRMGHEELIENEEVRLIYSQAAGLGHFFMDADGGSYRTPFIHYLKAIYDGNHGADSLARWMEQNYGELDQHYEAFLQVTDEDMAHLLPAKNIRRLSLGLTQVTDQGLRYLQGYDHLEWLDLSACNITDAGVASLADCESLVQLGLQSTRITDAAMEGLGSLTSLDELDLSGTAIGDAGLAHLSSLPQLKMLWLADTQVSDAGLQYLLPLQSLEAIDVDGSRVSASGLESLYQALPQLEPPSR